MPLNSRASGPSARSEKQESLRIVMRKVQSSLVCLLGLLTAVMSGQFHLHSIPDHSPLKVLLLRKCLRRIDKLKSFGIEKFVHEVISALTKSFDFSQYEGVEASDLEPIVEACKLFIIQIVNLGLTKEQVQEDTQTLGTSEETTLLIWNALLARKAEVRRALQNQHSSLNQNFLQDFDWKIHLSLASNYISVQRIPLLLLNLKLNVNEQEQTKTVTLELTREELDSLIATLEEVNSEVSQLRV